MSKSNLSKIALTTGLTASALFLICYILFFILPTFTFGMFNMMFHSIQMTNSFYPSFSGLILGLIYSFIVGWVIGAVYVLVYNQVFKK